MDFRTQIPLKPQSHNRIGYDSKIVLFGSCFTENISDKLDYFKFQNFNNPFGILFHPKAIENLITNAINEKVFSEDELFLLNERWHCFDIHSELSDTSQEVLLARLNSETRLTKEQLSEANHIVITVGTSWVYRLIETDSIVANCHKVPQKKFLKEILSVDEITESFEAIIALVRSINKHVSILFTVSPVRHIKDGFVENTQGKSHLIAAVHNVVEPRKNVHYFPSYELLIDELRDYRFFASDMIHPNQIAIDYIWKQFSKVWISEAAQQTMQEIETIQKGLSHRPFDSNSTRYKEFLINLENKMTVLQRENPTIKF